MNKKRNVLKIIIITVCILVILTVLLLLLLPPLVMGGSMMKGHFANKTYKPETYNVIAEKIQLHTDDGIKLVAWQTSVSPSYGTVILLSGIHNPSVTAFFSYAKLLNDNGYNAFLVEMRAHGESEGDLVSFGIEEWRDVQAAVDYIQASPDLANDPIVVMGTSMGGATAINAFGAIPDIDALISCSAFSSPADVFGDVMIQMEMPAVVAFAVKPFTNLWLGFMFGFEYATRMTPIQQIKNHAGRPMLLMHSTKDSQVPYDSFVRLIEVAPSSVETFIREGDEHFICYEYALETPSDDVEFSSALISFLNRNVKELSNLEVL